MSDERLRLGYLTEIFGRPHPETLIVPSLIGVCAQDDAAVVRVTDKISLVIASDFIRGTGFYLFELGYLNHYDVGFYLVAANLSDIAAMGIRPTGLTTVVRYNPNMTDEQFRQVFEGIRAAADLYDVEVVGGDIGGYSVDVFAATAFGFAKGDKVLLRSGARPGDLLCVTGTVGLPITALTYFKQAKTMGFQLPEAVEQRLLQSWKRPIPRIVEGTLLADNDIANACQDVSDGLKATIEEISIRSGITFTIYSEALPVHAATNEVSKFLGISAAQLALSASVDFELLFTIPRAVEERCSALFKERELSFSVIGHTNSSGQNEIVLDGITVPLPGTAWNQQYGDLIEQVVRRP